MHQRRGRDGDVKVDDRLSDGAAVGGDGGNRILAGVGCANIAEAASHADGGNAVRRGRKGLPLPPGMNSWFFEGLYMYQTLAQFISLLFLLTPLMTTYGVKAMFSRQFQDILA